MSLHDDVVRATQKEIDLHYASRSISPTVVAVAVQKTYGDIAEVHIEYGSLEFFKQIAREVLRRAFDPATGEDSKALQGDMFSGLLQDRYPQLRGKGDEPQYVQRDAMSDADVQWNLQHLRRSAEARLQHADALEAWWENRK